MKINKIRTSLLLLLLFTGVYNPIKAAANRTINYVSPPRHTQNVNKPALKMHIYYNNEASKPIELQRTSVTLIPEGQTTLQEDEERDTILTKLINALDSIQANGYDHIAILMECPIGHINQQLINPEQSKPAPNQSGNNPPQQDFRNLLYWAQLFKYDQLVRFTTLFIPTTATINEYGAKQALFAFAKRAANKGGLFFQQNKGHSAVNLKKIITKPSLEDAVAAHEGLIEVSNRVRDFLAQQLTEEGRKALNAGVQGTMGALFGRRAELSKRDREKLVEVDSTPAPNSTKRKSKIRIVKRSSYTKLLAPVDGMSAGIMVIVILFLAAYYKRDALAAFAHQQLNRKGL